MSPVEQLRIIFGLGPIVVLLGLGFWLTMQSGVVKLTSGQGMRRAAGNLSQTIVMVLACVALLMVLQQMVGFKLQIR